MHRTIAALLIYLGLASAALAPARAQQSVMVPATEASVIVGTVAAITQIIAPLTGQRIYLTAVMLRPIATSVVTLSYGTGTNCGTGTTVFYTGTFAAVENVIMGTGNGALYAVPISNAVCITIATAVAPGWISYAQF